MKTTLNIGAVLLTVAFLVGCGGSGGSSTTTDTVSDLRDQLKEAEAAKAEAERKAEEEKAQREREEVARRQAEQQATQREQERQQAEQERQEAEEERRVAQQKLNRLVAYEVVQAVPTTLDDATGNPAVTGVRHRQPATVPSPTFTNTSTGTLGGWFKTMLSGRAQNRIDTAEVYSNVEAPSREDIRDHSLGSTLTFDGNRPTNHIDVTTTKPVSYTHLTLPTICSV